MAPLTRSPRRAAAVLVAVLALVAPVLAGCLGAGAEASDRVAAGPDAAVIVPLGAVAPHAIATARERLVEMGFAPEVAATRDVWAASADRPRHQRVADVLLNQVLEAVPGAADGTGPFVLGLTAQDMYWVDRPEWGFVFALREQGRGGVISTARMDPRAFGEPADRALMDRRVDVMVVRVAGLSWRGAAVVEAPRCANRYEAVSLDDLDTMRPVLCEPGVPGA